MVNCFICIVRLLQVVAESCSRSDVDCFGRTGTSLAFLLCGERHQPNISSISRNEHDIKEKDKVRRYSMNSGMCHAFYSSTCRGGDLTAYWSYNFLQWPAYEQIIKALFHPDKSVPIHQHRMEVLVGVGGKSNQEPGYRMHATAGTGTALHAPIVLHS